jgi:hypothetical protein
VTNRRRVNQRRRKRRNDRITLNMDLLEGRFMAGVTYSTPGLFKYYFRGFGLNRQTYFIGEFKIVERQIISIITNN